MERRTRGWGAKIKPKRVDNQRGRHCPSSHPGCSPVQQIYHQASAQHVWGRHHIGGWALCGLFFCLRGGLKKKKKTVAGPTLWVFFFFGTVAGSRVTSMNSSAETESKVVH